MIRAHWFRDYYNTRLRTERFTDAKYGEFLMAGVPSYDSCPTTRRSAMTGVRTRLIPGLTLLTVDAEDGHRLGMIHLGGSQLPPPSAIVANGRIYVGSTYSRNEFYAAGL